VVRGLPPVDDGIYTFYAVLARPGTSPIIGNNQLTNVAAVSTGIIGPLQGPTPFFQNNVEIRDIILHALVPESSTVPVGCFVEVIARNLSTERAGVGLFFVARDANHNFLSNVVVTGDLKGGETAIIDGIVASTPLPQGADCSEIATLEGSGMTFVAGFE